LPPLDDPDDETVPEADPPLDEADFPPADESAVDDAKDDESLPEVFKNDPAPEVTVDNDRDVPSLAVGAREAASTTVPATLPEGALAAESALLDPPQPANPLMARATSPSPKTSPCRSMYIPNSLAANSVSKRSGEVSHDEERSNGEKRCGASRPCRQPRHHVFQKDHGPEALRPRLATGLPLTCKDIYIRKVGARTLSADVDTRE
jgi:hypothetical protein